PQRRGFVAVGGEVVDMADRVPLDEPGDQAFEVAVRVHAAIDGLLPGDGTEHGPAPLIECRRGQVARQDLAPEVDQGEEQLVDVERGGDLAAYPDEGPEIAGA